MLNADADWRSKEIVIGISLGQSGEMEIGISFCRRCVEGIGVSLDQKNVLAAVSDEISRRGQLNAVEEDLGCNTNLPCGSPRPCDVGKAVNDACRLVTTAEPR